MREDHTDPGMTDAGLITATERLPLLPDVERIFDAFVSNANAVAGQARTTLGAIPEEDPFPSAKTALAELVPLDVLEKDHPAFEARNDVEEAFLQTAEEAVTTQGALFDGALERDAIPLSVKKIAPPPRLPSELAERTVLAPAPAGPHTQKNEAQRLVPDVASVRPSEPPTRERSEDGQIPPRELERMMGDMQVLLRYTHDEEVARRLQELRRRYPNDLLLLRRIAEFHLEAGSTDLAKEALFQLASGLFRRKNVTGMRAALEQVLVLSPGDPRATKLVQLLDQR
ncbi:MAG: hypothetical protein AB8H86_04950 [Polyangiales bacterium]